MSAPRLLLQILRHEDLPVRQYLDRFQREKILLYLRLIPHRSHRQVGIGPGRGVNHLIPGLRTYYYFYLSLFILMGPFVATVIYAQ